MVSPLPTPAERIPDASPSAGRLTLALAPGVMLAGVAGGIAFPILPSVGMRVGLPLYLIGIILAANRVTRVLVNPIVGMMTDRFGGRRTLLVGLVLQIVVMALFVLGVKTTHPGAFFLAGRIVHGFGSSCVFVAAQALALHAGGSRRGGQVTGAVRAASQVGVPTGLVLGGVLSDLWSDTATFEIGAVALLVAFIIAFVGVPDLRVTAVQSRLVEVLRTFADARLGAIGALSFASAFAGSGMVLTMTTLLVHTRHLSIDSMPERATASILMGWLVLAEALAMPALGRAGDRFAAHALIAGAGLLLTIPALVGIAFAERTFTIAVGLGVLGIAVACLGPSLLALVATRIPPERFGLAVGALQVSADVGGALGPLLGTALFAGSIATPFLFTAGVNALLLPIAVWLVRDARRDPRAGEPRVRSGCGGTNK
jgi:MFS transporter, DHA1 family, multidrug resistance protein